jgi:anti-sigma regulatory factor (Ser/Thr protein kinase)
VTDTEIAVLDERLPNDVAAIGAFAERVEAFCEDGAIAPAIMFQLNLAIDELATNIIFYGWDDPGPHELRIRLSRTADRLRLLLEDDGRAFNPLEKDTPDVTLDVEDRPIGGLGIHFVRGFATTLAYERADGLNRLTIEKSL